MIHNQIGKRGHVAILLLLVGVAAWPFISRPGLPLETDAELHVFRLAELARLVSGGVLYPRWAPNFYFGYGYPIFNYYAPLAYYLGLPLALLNGVGAVVATKAVFVLTYVAGAWGIFGVVKDSWGRNAGLVAATAYIFSPYIQYVDPHARGDLAEFLSFGLFPLALWAYSRLNRRGTAQAFAAAVLMTAFVILSHNLMALVFFALLCAWVAWQVGNHLWNDQQHTARIAFGQWFRSRAVWLGLALVLGVCSSAFFWLPVGLEQDAVNLSTLIGDGSHFDFRNHFLQIGDLFGPTQWLDWGATEAEFTLNLGMAQWLLALLGIAGVVTGFARHRRQALFYSLAAIVFVFLMIEPSIPVWLAVPMMPYLQFPWRLLGPSAALLAILGGIGIRSLSDCLLQMGRRARSGSGEFALDGRRRNIGAFTLQLSSWLPALAIFILLVQSLPLAMVPPWPNANWDTSTSAVAAIERRGRWLGTTSTADFVPRTVEVLPGPQRTIIEQLLAGEPPDRVNRATLPQEAEVESEVVGPLHTRYHVSSQDGFLLRLFQFDFPGWQATVDGVFVETILGRPEGFIIIPVPPGNHIIDLSFGDTAVRRVAWAITVAGILLTAFLVSQRVAQTRRTTAQPDLRTNVATKKPTSTGSRAMLPMIMVTALFVIIFAIAQHNSFFHFQSEGWVAIPAEYDRFADLGEQLALIGFDTPLEVQRGEDLEVTLYWKAQQDMEINYQVFLHLLDASGVPVTQSDKLNPGDFPTRRWPTDKYVRDPHQLDIPASLLPGEYLLSTGMWVSDEGWRLPVLDDNGTQIGDSVPLYEITVR